MMVHTYSHVTAPPPLGYNNTTELCLNSSVQSPLNVTKPLLIQSSSRFWGYQERIMQLHHAIACFVDHGNLQLQQRACKSGLRLDIYVYQIICNRSNRVQMLRSISSRWRFKSPRGSTVTNAPFKLTSTWLEKITVNELFYKKIKMVFDHSVWTPLCWGYVGVRRLVTSFCLLICVANRWGSDDVGSSTQPPLNVLTGPHDFDANARGRHGPNDGNSQPTASAPTESMGSNTNNKTPRETNNSDTMSDSQCNKKQKQSHQKNTLVKY